MTTAAFDAQHALDGLDGLDDEWSGMTRARRVLVVVDLVESVRLMQQQEASAIQRWRRFVNEVRTQILPARHGRLVKSLGDGLLLEFDNVHSAVAAAQACRAAMKPLNTGMPAGAGMLLRAGIHVAEVVVDELDLYGTGVNLAARLAGLAGPDEIVVSAEVRDELLPGVDVEVEDLGECWIKGFVEPVRAYRLCASAAGVGAMLVDRGDLRPVLAILPFVADDGSPALRCVGELLASEVQALLAPNTGLKVIARPSVTAIAARGVPDQVWPGLVGAEYQLTGRVAAGGPGLLFTLTLRSARAGEALMQQVFAATLQDLHASDSQIALQVAETVGQAILAQQLQLARLLPLPNLQDHALLFGGVALMHRFSRREFFRAGELLRALAERAPRHGLPAAWLARWHLFLVIQGWTVDRQADCQRAEDFARRALDLDPRSSLALAIAGSVRVQLLHDVVGAEALYRRAIAVNPQEPLAWLLLGTACGFQGRGDEAVEHSETALGLSPVDPMRFFFDVHGSAAALAARRFDRAIFLARRALRANRLHTTTYRSLAIAQALSGRVQEARDTVEQLRLLEPDYSVQTFLSRSAGAQFGQGPEFAAALREAGLPEHSIEQPTPPPHRPEDRP